VLQGYLTGSAPGEAVAIDDPQEGTGSDETRGDER
jgi:hypothetical protein